MVRTEWNYDTGFPWDSDEELPNVDFNGFPLPDSDPDDPAYLAYNDDTYEYIDPDDQETYSRRHGNPQATTVTIVFPGAPRAHHGPNSVSNTTRIDRHDEEQDDSDEPTGLVDLEASEDESEADSASDSNSVDPEDHEQDESDEAAGFFDLEASEEDSEDGSVSASTDDLASFPQFTRLPKELQHMVWEHFCPLLNKEPRVIELIFYEGPSRKYNGPRHKATTNTCVTAKPATILDAEAMLKLLAVSSSSRSLGLSYWPHRVQLITGGIIPYHRERDILLCDWSYPSYRPGVAAAIVLNQAAPYAQNLAVSLNYGDGLFSDIEERLGWLREVPSLRNVYVFRDDFWRVPNKALAWTVSEGSCQYLSHFQEESEDTGIMYDIRVVFCWPDPDKYGDSDKSEFCRHKFGMLEREQEVEIDRGLVWLWANTISDLRSMIHRESTDAAETVADEKRAAVRVWPIARFEDRDGLYRLAYMKERLGSDDVWDSGSEDDESVEDEDESDGIDDTSLDGFIATDDEDDDDDMPAHLLDTSSQASAGINPAVAHFSSDSDVSDSSEESGTEAGSEPSSSRRQHIVLDDSDEEEEDDVITRETTNSANRRARPVVIDSDDGDEEEEEGKPQNSAPRSARNRAIVVDSDEDEDDMPQSTRTGPGRAQRAAALPDSDDEDSQEDEVQPKATTNRRPRAAVESESEDSSEESSEEETAPPSRPSLAQRLAMEYQQPRSRRQRTSHSDDDDESDADGYGGASDEESDEDASQGDELTLDMAEEHDDDEDDEDGA